MLLIDTKGYDDCTLGRLHYGAFSCFTLELPWMRNQQNISCIPAGVYTCTKYQSPKHGEVVLFDNVVSRSMIEIHAGNYTRQILGCVLVGDGIKYLDGDDVPDVTNSKNTLGRLLAALPSNFDARITRT